MTICPIAIVAGCRKCPAFSICPLKTVIGDAGKSDNVAAAKPPPKPGQRPGADGRTKK
jgi:hypothetical protein